MNTNSQDLDVGSANDLSTSPADTCAGRGNPAGRGMADWLALAAAPTFAFMALLTVVGGREDMLCSAELVVSQLTGMAAMYLLMSVFHSAPWLKLVFAGGRGNS